MRLWALDLATVSGFAYGEVGHIPKSGSVRLRKKGEDREVVAFNLLAFLRDRFVLDRPDRVYIEHWMAPKAQPSADAVVVQLMLHGVAQGLLRAYGVEPVLVHPQTWRKHFIGTSNAGNRDATKQMTIRRARALRLIPADCCDDNRADAVGIFDFASAQLGHPINFTLYGATA